MLDPITQVIDMDGQSLGMLTFDAIQTDLHI